MISRLHGLILEKQPPYLLIDVAGVGYEVQAPMTSFYPLPPVGQSVILHTHLSVSETSQQLFAFYTQDERRLFRTLIKVSGVGPKMALAILSGMAVEEFVHCVHDSDVNALVKVPGVGKKTAERLLIEMKDRLKDWTVDGSSVAALQADHTAPPADDISADAESALIALGYRPAEATKVITTIKKTATPANSEEMIRLALKHLAG